MVLRHIGEISVRVDDLEDKEWRLVGSSIRLVKDINMRDGIQLLAWFVSTMLMVITTLVIWATSKYQLVTQTEVQYISGVVGICVVLGYIISMPFARSSERRTRQDILALCVNMKESERCRELVEAYRQAHPGFQQIMDRAGGTTQPKTA